MGYTHYWGERTDDGDEAWKRLIDRASKAIKLARVKVRLGPLQIDYRAIRLNGVGEDGHETFCLSRAGEEFTFCKTARKPYDLVVTAILTIAMEEIGLDVSSDGAMRGERYEDDGFNDTVTDAMATKMHAVEWTPGQELAEKTK